MIEVLQALVRLELAIGELYKACAREWPEDSQFWLAVASQEASHAAAIKRMSSLIALKPDQVTLAKPIRSAAVNTILSGIEQKTEQIRAGKLLPMNALHIALDLENSILEKKFYELIRSTEPSCLQMCRDIADQTREHKELFEKRIAALNT